MKICSMPDCVKKHRAHGYCAMHLHRVRRHGDPNVVLQRSKHEPPPECSVDECERDATTRGWCEMHYARWRRHGSTDSLFRTGCSYPGCEGRHFGHGLCERHCRQRREILRDTSLTRRYMERSHPADAAVAALERFGGLTHSEIALRTGIPRRTIIRIIQGQQETVHPRTIDRLEVAV